MEKAKKPAKMTDEELVNKLLGPEICVGNALFLDAADALGVLEYGKGCKGDLEGLADQLHGFAEVILETEKRIRDHAK